MGAHLSQVTEQPWPPVTELQLLCCCLVVPGALLHFYDVQVAFFWLWLCFFILEFTRHTWRWTWFMVVTSRPDLPPVLQTTRQIWQPHIVVCADNDASLKPPSCGTGTQACDTELRTRCRCCLRHRTDVFLLDCLLLFTQDKSSLPVSAYIVIIMILISFSSQR